MLEEAAGPAAIVAPEWVRLEGGLHYHTGTHHLVDALNAPITCLKGSHLSWIRYLPDVEMGRHVLTKSLLEKLLLNPTITGIDLGPKDMPFEVEDWDLFLEVIQSCPNLQSFRLAFRADESELFEKVVKALAESQVTSVDLGIPADGGFPYKVVSDLLCQSSALKSIALGGMQLNDKALFDLAMTVKLHNAIESVAFDPFAPTEAWEAFKRDVQSQTEEERAQHREVVQRDGVDELVAAFEMNKRLRRFDLTSPCILSEATFWKLHRLLLDRMTSPIDLGLDKGYCLTHDFSSLQPLYALALRMQTHVRYLQALGPKDHGFLHSAKVSLKHILDKDPTAKHLTALQRGYLDGLTEQKYPLYGLGFHASKRRRVDKSGEAPESGAAAGPAGAGL